MKSYRFLHTATIVIAVLIQTAAFSAPVSVPDTVVFGSDYNFPPYEFINKNGEPSGFHVDLIRAIGKDAGFEVKVKLGVWSEIREELETHGTVHVSDMFYSKLRDSIVDYAIPHEIMYDVIVVRSGEDAPATLAELPGRIVGVQAGSGMSDYLGMYHEDIRKLEFTTEQEAVFALLKKDVDAAIISNLMLKELAREKAIRRLIHTSGPVSAREYSFVVASGNTELLRTINVSLAKLMDDGTFQKIRDKWFKKHIKTLIIRNSLLILAVILSFISWSVILRIRINKRTKDLKDEIQERKRTELLLRDQYRELRSVYRNSPIGIAFIGPDYKIIRINARMAGYYNSDTTTLTGKSVKSLKSSNPPIDLDEIRKIFEKDGISSPDKDVKSSETRLESETGAWLSVYNPVSGESGQILGIVVASQDISELQATRASLKHNEELFRGIVLSSPDLIALTDKEGRITYLSPNAEHYTGYKIEEFLGTIIPPIIHPDDYEICNNQLKAIISGKSTLKRFQYRIIDKSGNIRWVIQTITPAYVNEKKIGFLYNIRDITTQKRLETQIMQARDKALDSDRLKSAFLANMSHEIRTPLNAIVGFCDIISNENQLKEPELAYFNIINQASRQLTGIVSDILEMSRIEAGQIAISLSDVTIKDIVTETEVINRHSVMNKGLDLRLNIKCDFALSISTDPVKLKQVLSNLIQNSVKFTDSGYIELGCEVMDSEIVFRVKDSGIGISAELQDVIFDRFRQGNESFTRTHGGSGLGLAISKGIIEKLGGRIWVESEPGKGASFFVSLPMTDNETSSESPSADVLQSEIPSSGATRILIAEDEDANYLYLATVIKKLGYEVLRAENGAECVELLESNPDISLILMDLRMPVMDGSTAAANIRSRDYDLPIIALTAFTLAAETERALAAGCNEVFIKPVSGETIKSLLDRYC